MNRDDVNRELNRLIAHYRALPFADLLVLADQPTIETVTSTPDGGVTFLIDVRTASTDSVRVNVSAFGNNWFKLQRIDESVTVHRAARSDG